MEKIQMIAVNHKDGMACVWDGTKFLIIKPPYEGKGSPIKPEDISKAVSKGFSAVDLEFKSFEEVFKFLREKLLKGEWEKPISEEPISE